MAPDVVLLHGFTHTGASWDPVIAALTDVPARAERYRADLPARAERYRADLPARAGPYRALAPDIRGHGSAAERVPVTLEAVLADLAALAPEQFTLVGYSMGGRIALHAALARADRVERLVLIGASPGIADPAERAARRAADDALADELEDSRIEEFATRWARTPVLAGQPPDVLAAVHADRLRNRPAGLARALRGLGTGALPSLWGRLAEIQGPVTLVVGERDQKFRVIAAQMASELQDGEVVIVPGAGHAVHLEAPSSVAAAIERGRD